MIHLLIIGFVTILGQTVLLRELNVAFYGVELIYLLALGFWLLWTALGALLARRNLDPAPASLGLLFVLFAILLPADVVFIRSIRIVFSGIPGAYLSFGDQMLAMSIALLPPGLLSGLMFQRAAKLYVGGGRTLAVAYAVESAGGLLGGSAATLLMRFGAANLTAAILCALVSAAVILAFRNSGRFVRPASAVLSGLLLLALWNARAADRAMTAWTHPHLLDTRDSPYGRVTAEKAGGQVSVFENDALSFETEGSDAEEFVHLAALQHPRPDRVLILGGGIEGTVREVLKHDPATVDYVELNPVLLDMVAPSLDRETRSSLESAGVRIVIADPRRFLERAGRYDLILVGMPEPDSGQANRFYTREFFSRCAARLNTGGVMAFRLRSSENLWTPQLTLRTASIYRALQQAFSHVLVLPGGTNTVIASNGILLEDPDVLASRLDARRVEARLVSRPYIRYIYTNPRFATIARLMETTEAAPNTDTQPVCYRYTVMIWLSRFFPRLAAIDFPFAPAAAEKGVQSPVFWLPALAAAVLFSLVRRSPSASRTLLAATAGLAGMVLETLLLLHYQVTNGVLYQDIGVLLMSFMLGLAAGALAADGLFHRKGRRRRHGAVLLAGFALLSALMASTIGGEGGGGLAATGGMLLVTGFFVAALFAYASVARVGDQREVIAPLYAADLAGGCIGSLLASLFLMPFAGMVATAVWVAPVAMAAMLLL